MASQKYQAPHDPPAEAPKFIPLDKRTMAEKSLVGSNRVLESKPESESESDSSDDEEMVDSSREDFKKQTLVALQRKAFYSVLQAFITETSIISYKRSEIIESLMNEWKIPQEIHLSFVDKIQKNLQTIPQSDDSSAYVEKKLQTEQEKKELQTEQGKKLQKKQGKKPLIEPSWSSVLNSDGSWGRVNPESLVGKKVAIRNFYDAEFVEYIIKAYDREQDKHCLVAANSNDMEIDGLFDLRKIEPEFIMWEGGHMPGFDLPKKPSVRRSLYI